MSMEEEARQRIIRDVIRERVKNPDQWDEKETYDLWLQTVTAELEKWKQDLEQSRPWNKMHRKDFIHQRSVHLAAMLFAFMEYNEKTRAMMRESGQEEVPRLPMHNPRYDMPPPRRY